VKRVAHQPVDLPVVRSRRRRNRILKA
jgi:hypothetical protein